MVKTFGTEKYWVLVIQAIYTSQAGAKCEKVFLSKDSLVLKNIFQYFNEKLVCVCVVFPC